MWNYTRFLLLASAILAAHSTDAAASSFKFPPTSQSIPVKALGKLNIPNPSAAGIVFPDAPILAVTSVNGSGKGAVYTVDVLAHLGGFSKKKAVLYPDSEFHWPSNVVAAPPSSFMGFNGVVLAGAVPAVAGPRESGGIYFSQLIGNGQTPGPWIRLITKTGFYYHGIVFADLLGNGQPQMVACRSAGHGGGAPSYVVTLRPAVANMPLADWEEIVLGRGCTALAVRDIDGDSIPEIAVVSGPALAVYTDRESHWRDASTVQRVLFTGPPLFGGADIQIVDLDNDGRLDMIVSEQSNGGTVMLYRNSGRPVSEGQWGIYPIISGFVPPASPNKTPLASLAVFQPQNADPAYPSIAIAAGGEGHLVYVLVPSDAFVYKITTLFDCACTVGRLAAGDTNDDGKVELFVPCTGRNNLAAFSIGS